MDLERAQRRVQIAKELFKAWSSSDADRPEKFFHPDGCLRDRAAGEEFKGWPAIRSFFAPGCTDEARNDPEFDKNGLFPQRFWMGQDGSVTLSWEITGVVRDDKMFGPDAVGKRFSAIGMSILDFNDDDLIIYEEDIWNGGEIPKSLGVDPSKSPL